MQLQRELLRAAELLCAQVTQGQPGCGGGRAPSSAQDTMEGTHCRRIHCGFAGLGPVVSSLLDRDMALSERSWGRCAIQVLCSGGCEPVGRNERPGKKTRRTAAAPVFCAPERSLPNSHELLQEAWAEMLTNASVLQSGCAGGQ